MVPEGFYTAGKTPKHSLMYQQPPFGEGQYSRCQCCSFVRGGGAAHFTGEVSEFQRGPQAVLLAHEPELFQQHSLHKLPLMYPLRSAGSQPTAPQAS